MNTLDFRRRRHHPGYGHDGFPIQAHTANKSIIVTETRMYTSIPARIYLSNINHPIKDKAGPMTRIAIISVLLVFSLGDCFIIIEYYLCCKHIRSPFLGTNLHDSSLMRWNIKMMSVWRTSYPQVFSTITNSTVKGGLHLKTLFRFAFKLTLSGGHSLIRLSRWLLFAVYTRLGSKRPFWRCLSGS